MIGNRENLAYMQSDFYREKYRKFLRWLLASIVVTVMLICVIIYLILFKAPTQYYASTTDGVILPLSLKQGS